MPDVRPGPPAPTRPSRLAHLAPLAYVALSVGFLADVALSGRAYVLRDLVTFFHPWQSAVRDAVAGGHLPLWNHDSFCGMPLLANLQSGFFYPPNWLYWFLSFDMALTAGMLLHLTVAAIAMRAFLLRVGLAPMASFVGGALFAYGTWTFAHLEFPMQLGAAVWLPLAWTGIWMAMREAESLGVVLAGGALTLSLLSGYPQITFLGCISASLLAAMLVPGTVRAKGRARAGVLAWPASVLLALALAAVQLLPAADMAELSTKAAAYPADVAMSRSLPWMGIVALFDPYFHGLPGFERYWGGDTQEFAFGTFYIGVVPLVWIAVGAFRTLVRPKRVRRVRREDFTIPDEETVVPPVVTWFLLAGAVFALLLALGKHTPLYPLLHAHVPGFARIRWPAAAGFLIAVHLAALAAVGFRAIVRDRGRIRLAALATLAIGAWLLVVWMLASGPLGRLVGSIQTAGAVPWQVDAHAAARGEWLGSLLTRAAVVLVTGGITLVFLDIRSRVGLAWVLMLLADLFLTSRWFSFPSASGFYDEVPAAVVELREELGGRRVYVPNSTSQLGNFLYGTRNLDAFRWAKRALLCNANMPAGLSAAHGCDPLGPRRHEAFAQAFAAPGTPWEIKERIFDLWDAGLYLAAPGVDPLAVPRITDPDRGIETSRHEPQLGRAMLLADWRTVEPGPGVLEALFAPDHDPANTTLLEAVTGAAPPRAPSPAVSKRGEILSHELAPNAIQVSWQIGAAGVLRVLESWDPGWTATVNGQPAPVLRADFLFLAVPVPEGPCDVRLTYRPASLRTGAAVSAAGIALLIAFAVFSVPRRAQRKA
ncbi:MAG: YfhO family protein [Candidatus Eiseniibacteriota bacterium]